MIENCLPNHKVCSLWSYHSGYCHLIQISCLNISTGRGCLFKLKEHQLVQIWVRIVKISFNVILLSWHFWVLGSTRLIFCHTLFFLFDFSGAAKSLSCGNILKIRSIICCETQKLMLPLWIFWSLVKNKIAYFCHNNVVLLGIICQNKHIIF